MKRRIRKTLSLALALIMLLSMVPLVYAAEDADEFAGLETLEEIPFEFVLEPEDLPYELLREAVLDVRDIPDCIDPALAEERGHVNRLYLQEPDDCTVMFQNRDGSKTIYLFSHPVKGMTATTARAFEINGTSLSFTFSNAITSRVGVTLSNFNIGYAEVAYIPGGVLTEDGVNITEDVRDWARGESTVSALAYNISGEAAAEYAASVAVPETDAAATAAAAPGITITPNDPAPLGGMTVMSISYSDLAGAMRFKNVSTNEYLTFSNSSLTVSTSFQLKYSEWVVQYDSFFGYVVSNLSDPYNTYIGYDDTETFMIDTLSYMMYAIEPVIVSTSASTVRLQCSLSAIDSNAQMYELSPDESDYPDSCTWQIMNKRNIRLVTSISVPTTIVEQSGVSFTYSNRYSFPQPYPTYYEMKLYDAISNEPFEFDTITYEDDEYWCTVDTPGDYTVYFKDEVTRIKSPEFTLTVVDHIIIPESDVRIEQKNVGFTLDYTFYPGASTYSNVKLYYAGTNTEVPHTGNTYTISTPGVYTVYYKDSYSGVKSEEFSTVVYEIPDFTIPNSLAQPTFSIQPIDDPTKYLTMNVSASEVTSLEVEEYNITEQPSTGQYGAIYNNFYESWKQLSRSFTISYSTTISSKYKISSILTTSQYDMPPRSAIFDVKYSGDPYYLTSVTNKANSLNISHTTAGLTTQSELGTDLTVLNVGDYFLIFSTTTDSNNILNNKALKYVESNNTIVADNYDPLDTSFMWSIKQIGINAPLIRQTQKYICGAATFLQVLYGAGIGEQVASTVNPNKGLHSQISTLAYSRESGKTETILPYYQRQNDNGTWNAGTSQDAFAESINEYSLFVGNASGQYGRYIIRNKQNVLQNGVSNSEIKSKIAFSLSKGWSPFVLTRAGGVPYKYDSGEAHYVCIIGLVEHVDVNNSLQSYVIVSNCHYTDKVLGIYAIPFDEFCNNISELFYYY